ncbi:MAG: hypothetical protein ACXWE0_11165 [Nitrososphaeraceae archaeon]
MEIYFEFSLAHSSNLFDIDVIVIAARLEDPNLFLLEWVIDLTI